MIRILCIMIQNHVPDSVEKKCTPGSPLQVKTGRAFHGWCKKSLKIPKGQSEYVNRRRTNKTMVANA